jgi:preprotein translocase subunit SecD
MNRYPLWKYVLIVAIVLASAVYALPNLYGKDPALQISAARTAQIDDATELGVKAALAEAQVTPKMIERGPSDIVVRFTSTADQLKAQNAVSEVLGPNYVVALNLAAATPTWLGNLGAEPMFLGLDLRGGVHFLMEVDMAAAVRKAEERYVSDLRALLREEKIRYRTVGHAAQGGVVVRLRDAEDQARTVALIEKNFPELVIRELQQGGEYEVAGQLSEQAVKNIEELALQQNITTLRKRVNELGVAEPVIQQQGGSRVVVQLPGVQDTARAKEILGATATLEFRMVDTKHDVQDAVDGRVPVGSRLYYDREGKPVLLDKDLMLTGDSIIDATSGIDQTSGGPAVFITLDGKGAAIFARKTRDQVGNPLAVVFIENKTETARDEYGQMVKRKQTIEEVINIATIREQLGKRFQITGLDSTQEARNLALLLRAGALAAPIDIIEERTVGPSLGQDNIEQGFRSLMIGFALVCLFMVVYYRLFGIVADVALMLNVVLLVALMSLLQATLTLPGIAGILLTVGMAVDANVLINERIREELRNGNTPQASIHAGYEKAFATIADANITTIIAAIVLFGLGTGPIKGFAVTLSLGILCSMFTAIMVSRAIINLIYGGRKVASLSI